jgi:hypothetical protein
LTLMVNGPTKRTAMDTRRGLKAIVRAATRDESIPWARTSYKPDSRDQRHTETEKEAKEKEERVGE